MRRSAIWWADVAWRLPVVVVLRVPLILVGRVLSAVGSGLEWLGERMPGLPYGLFTPKERRP